MSTRATLSHGPNFHLFEEVFDDEHVYLELQGTEFEATPGGVCVQIPLPVWEVIRKHTLFDDSLADLDDAALRAKVEVQVDERIAEHNRNELPRFAGGGVFGSPDSPRKEQVENGLNWYREKRERQRRQREAIRRLRAGEEDA